MPTFPVTLSLEEACAAALAEAARRLGADTDAQSFVEALSHNHLLWRALTMAARHNGWDVGDPRTVGFVMDTLRKCGFGVVDSDIEGLIAINLGVADRLLAGRPLDRVVERAHHAWRQAERPITLEDWLLQQIEYKTMRRLAMSARFPPAEPLQAAAPAHRPSTERRS